MEPDSGQSSEGLSRRNALKLAGAVALGGAALTVAQSAEAASPQVAAGDAATSSRFSVEIDGVVVPAVTGVEGLESASDPSGVGTASVNTLSITREFSVKDSSFVLWRRAAAAGFIDRKSVSILFYNDAGVEVGRINLYQCWPVKWQGPSLNARNSGHASETLEIAWENIELKA